jgi:F-box and WD-40 domain protein CDC4
MLVTDEHALIGNSDGQLQWIDPDTAHTRWLMNGHTGYISCIVYCPELSRVITTAMHDSTARVRDVATGQCVHMLRRHTREVLCAAVHGTTYVNSTL